MLSTRQDASSESHRAIDGSSPLQLRLRYLHSLHRQRLRSVLLTLAAVIAVMWIVAAVAIGSHG